MFTHSYASPAHHWLAVRTSFLCDIPVTQKGRRFRCTTRRARRSSPSTNATFHFGPSYCPRHFRRSATSASLANAGFGASPPAIHLTIFQSTPKHVVKSLPPSSVGISSPSSPFSGSERKVSVMLSDWTQLGSISGLGLGVSGGRLLFAGEPTLVEPAVFSGEGRCGI